MPKYTEELVNRQLRRSELARKKRVEMGEPCRHPVITVSRRMGSGARVIAAKLAEDLGWSLWDKELINAIAEDAVVSRRVVESFDEKTISEIELFARGTLGDFETSGFLYPVHLARAVGAIARHGDAIILGRGANFLLPDALNIRIDASDEVRIRNMMSYENLTHDEAVRKLHESDKEREQFIARIYGRERVEHSHYDLMIWMDEFSNDDAVEIIEVALKAWCRRGEEGKGNRK